MFFSRDFDAGGADGNCVAAVIGREFAGDAFSDGAVFFAGPSAQFKGVITRFGHVNCPASIAFHPTADRTLIPGRFAVFVVPIVGCDYGDGFAFRADDDGYVFAKAFGDKCPPVFVVLAQFGDDIGMLLGDIVALSVVGVHVVEFFAVDEPPALCHGRAFAPFDGVFHALRVRDQCAVGPVVRAFEEGFDAGAVDAFAGFVGNGDVTEVAKGGQEVDVGNEGVDVPSAGVSPRGPVKEEGDAMPAFVFRAFFSAHAIVKTICDIGIAVEVAAVGRAIVGHKYEDGVFFQSLFAEEVAHEADVFVDVGDHAVKAVALAGQAVAVVEFAVVIGYVEGTVRRVGGDVAEEGCVAAVFDKFFGFVKPDVRAVASEFFRYAVAEVRVVEIGIAPVVRSLVYAAAAVVNDRVKAPVMWVKWIVVAQVPFAKHAGAISRCFEKVCDGGFVLAQ